MKRSVLRLSALAAVLAFTAAPGSGSPADPSVTVRLNLDASRPRFEPAGDGASRVARIEGFGLTSRVGEPMLPIRIVLAAIPEEGLPELRILGARSEVIPNVEIAPVPRGRVLDRERERIGVPPGRNGRSGRDGTDRGIVKDFLGAPGIFGRDAEFPASPVRLGAVGFMREQRYVEVLFSPLLYNPARREIRYYPEVRVEVVVPTPPASAAAATPEAIHPDPFFEENYRKSLANYEQGRSFRAHARAARASSSAVLASAAAQTVPVSAEASPQATGAPRFKILVSRQGIYRLDSSYLSANAPDLINTDPRTWMLRAEGIEVPISLRNTAGGSAETGSPLGPGDFLEFFGRPKTEPPSVLVPNLPSSFPDIYQANDFTDTQVYWLSSEGSAGSHLRIPQTSGAPVNAGFPIAADFQDTAIWDENNIYLPIGAEDPFFSQPSLFAGSSSAQRDVGLAIPGIAVTGSAASVRVRLRGGTDLTDFNPDHKTVVWLNGDTAHASTQLWDGETVTDWTFGVAQSVLTDPTTIHLSAPGIAGVPLDRQYPDKVIVSYRRRFSALGEVLDFSYPNQNARFQIGGFSGSVPVIYDVSRSRPGSTEADPILITGASVSGSPATFTFDVPLDASAGAPATRSFEVVSSLSGGGPVGFRLPDAMIRAADPVLSDPQNAADIVVIGSRDTLDPSPGGALDNLLAHRLATQGLTSKVVFVDQIYDEFGFGQRSLYAIRSFLAYAFDNWKGTSGAARPPSFVLLVGDATPDYKHTLPDSFYPDWIDQVPTPIMMEVNSVLGYYSSDNWLASFRGADQIPDISLGRISARSAAEAAGIFDKIRAYEEAPPAGPWKGHAVLTAGDGKDPFEAGGFEAVQNSLTASYFSAAPWTVPSPPLYFAEPPWSGTDSTGFRNALITQINGGTAVLSYVGHGSFDLWGANLTFFTAADATQLTNGSLLPFMINVNCLSGGFQYFVASGSLGEAMTNNPGGGAIATFAPSGLSNVSVGTLVGDQLFGPLFGREEQRILGPATLSLRTALWSGGYAIDAQSYTFLGDPATVLATPAPPPPSGLTAVAGNGQVALSWTAPATPVAGYRIYRAAPLTPPPAPDQIYAAVACDSTGSTSCVDHTVNNATTYYYYAVSIDSGGFGGRASNFNTGCDSGPDCVVARPTNPGPPSPPTGLTAADPGSGGRLNVSWQKNSESDIKSYTLYYGTLPGNGTIPGTYTAAAIVPASTTSITLNGLTDSVRYYMAVSATNTSGHESALSAEVSGVPHLIQGITPPRSISDLKIVRSAGDLVLTWSRPTVDIYGSPTTVVRYTIYRGTTPAYVPALTTPLAVINDGSITTYTDAGAALLPSNFYYMVTATDANGLVSGAGRELPNGVVDLGVSIPSAGVVRLTWTQVGTDVQGLPTLIDHYQIHESTLPFSRQSIGAGTLLMDNVRVTSIDLSLTGNPLYLSVIAVDDRGNLSPF
jgi:Peptidase family C25/Propeptide_C25/Fibronectin type III domain